MPLLENDLYDLFYTASCGSLSDDYEYFDFKNLYSVVKDCKNISNTSMVDDENLKISYSYNEKNIILTQLARTVSRAKENLEENIQFLKESDDEK